MKKKSLFFICLSLILAGCASQSQSEQTNESIMIREEVTTADLEVEENEGKSHPLQVAFQGAFQKADGMWEQSLMELRAKEPVLENQFCGMYNNYFTYLTGSALWKGDLSQIWEQYVPEQNTEGVFFMDLDRDGKNEFFTSAQSEQDESITIIKVQKEAEDGMISDFVEAIEYENGKGGFLRYEDEYYYLHEIIDHHTGFMTGASLVRFYDDGYYEEMEIRFEDFDYQQEVLFIEKGYEDAVSAVLEYADSIFLDIRADDWSLIMAGEGYPSYTYQMAETTVDGQIYNIHFLKVGMDYLIQVGIYEDETEDSFKELGVSYLHSDKKMIMILARLTGWDEQLEFLGFTE